MEDNSLQRHCSRALQAEISRSTVFSP